VCRQICFLSVTAVAFAQQSAFDGKIIRQVSYVPAAQPLTAGQLNAANALHAGDRFRSANAAATIDHLFASGRYADIQVDVQPSEDGVSVRILTASQLFIGHVAIEGGVDQSPSSIELVDATRLRLGEPLYEDELREAERNLDRLLNQNGLYEHKIRVEFHDHPSVQQRDLTFVVDAGPRAKYEAPVIQGDAKLPEGDIIRATGWRWRFIHLWRKVTQQRTNKGVVGVLRKYEDEGLLTANVANRSPQYNAGTNRLRSTLDIQAGPRVEVRAVNAHVSKSTLKRYVPVYQELAVDRDLMVAGVGNLRDYFQSEGYFDVTVDFRQSQPDPDHLVIEYAVDLGRRYKLVHVEIRGNKFFSTGDLRERMFLKEAGFLRLRHGRYSETFLERDREAIANLYKANGFRDVEVTSSVQKNYKGNPGDVAVTITVEEGPMWRVRGLKFEGVKSLDANSLRPFLSSISGQPYSELNVTLDRNSILTEYHAEGYPDAAFQWNADMDSEAHRVDLIYEITEGRRQTVRDITLTGIDTTRPELVNREITLGPGDPLSLVEMSDIQRRLYQLGVFSRIDMAIQNDAGQTEAKHLIYDFHEASRYRLAVGGGAEVARIGGTTTDLSAPGNSTGFSPRVSVDLTRLNFLGLGHSISLRGQLSTLEQAGSFNYLAPRFRNVEGRNVMFTTSYDLSRDVRTFSSRREEASIQVSQQVSKPSNILFRFAYRRVSASDIVIPRLLIPQLAQPVRIGILSSNYVQDRRDNPADTTRGLYDTLDLGVASSAFGSQRSFIRLLGRNATYYPLTPSVVLARETSFGIIYPFDLPAGVDAADAIPLPERFFGGGSATHRGFPENQAGPRDTGTGPGSTQATGFPLGGNALFFNNIELRFPLLGENIKGVLFHDAGNIYDTIGDISFRVHQHSDADFNYMVHAAGFGVRYKTPVGPIRADFAYSINPPHYQGFAGSAQDLLNCGPAGSSTACQSVPQQVSHFQFFFSIGQTF
jgi:outer membrane protein insertion porin family